MSGRWCWCGLTWLPVGTDAITETDETHAEVACARHPQKETT